MPYVFFGKRYQFSFLPDLKGFVMKKNRISGFTLIELLIVIAIIGMLAQMILPAVQMARESARRIHCTNNLKQMGLALQLHHGSKGNFPASSDVSPVKGVTRENDDCCWVAPSKTGWTIEILPYLEQQAVYDLFDPDVTVGHENNFTFRNTNVPNFSCPSDYKPRQLVPKSGLEGGWIGKSKDNPKYMYWTSSYRANTGRVNQQNQTWYLGENLGPLINQTGVGEGTGGLGWRGPMHVKGTFSEDTPGGYILGVESLKNIEDGASRTLMVGEQTLKLGNKYANLLGQRRSFWAYTWGGYNASQAWMDRRMFSGDYLECSSQANPDSGLLVCQSMWYSYHLGGGNFLRCDGSVTHIKFDIDLETFGSLCSIAGGELE